MNNFHKHFATNEISILLYKKFALLQKDNNVNVGSRCLTLLNY